MYYECVERTIEVDLPGAVVSTHIPPILRYFAARLAPFSYNNQRIRNQGYSFA